METKHAPSWRSLPPDDHKTIMKIAKRASDLAITFGEVAEPLEIMMDLTAVHAYHPLRLAELLAADDGNFGHDVFGIRLHLNRETRRLENHFSPRFTAINLARERA